jgi:hypothetical protein
LLLLRYSGCFPFRPALGHPLATLSLPRFLFSMFGSSGAFILLLAPGCFRDPAHL